MIQKLDHNFFKQYLNFLFPCARRYFEAGISVNIRISGPTSIPTVSLTSAKWGTILQDYFQ